MLNSRLVSIFWTCLFWMCLPLVGHGATAALPSAAVGDTELVSVVVIDPEGRSVAVAEAARIEATALDGSESQLSIPLASNPIDLRLPVETRWRVCAVAADVWSTCEIVVPASAPPVGGTVTATRSVRLRSWPLATIEGRLRLADHAKPIPAEVLERLKVTVGPSPGKPAPHGFVDTVVSCTVEPEGLFTCPVPALPLYTAVRSSGYVSRYFWDLAPTGGASVDLGAVLLRRGASLSGSVDLAGEGVTAEHVDVRMMPALAPSVSPSIAGAIAKDTMVETVSPYGFFQFAGVKPGAYMLEVSHPGFATARPGPFEVYDGKETALRSPIVLERPIRLDLTIEPPASPLGSPWFVRIFRQRQWSAGSDLVFNGDVPDDGYLFVLDQSPGLFRIALSDREGNRFHESDARVERGDSGIHVVVPVVKVRGTLRLGGEPLAGTLLFGGRSGGRRSRMTADAEGEFKGVVAGDGGWTIEISSDDPPLETKKRVEIAGGRDRVAELEIDLPDTEINGRVIDDSGRAVPEARVKAEAQDFVSTTTITDGEGRFHFRALPEGRTVVAASGTIAGRAATSEPVEVTLSDDGAAIPVDLVLRRVHTVRGSVHSFSGLVAGARVYASTLGLPIPWNVSSVSDVDGSFTLDLPVDEGLLALIYFAPGGFLTTAIRPIEDPLELRTTEAGGDLVIDLPETSEPMPLFSLEREGVFISPGLLIQWAAGHGLRVNAPLSGLLHLPRLAEGQYRACLVDPAARRRAQQQGESLQTVVSEATRCTEGTLSAGGTLELALDAGE